MNAQIGIALAAGLVLIGCESAEQHVAPNSDAQARAQRIAQEMLIVDTHIDVPYRLQMEWNDVSQKTAGGDFDYPRAIAGGLNAGFMSIYTDPKLEAEGRSKEVADTLLDIVDRLVSESPEKFAIALSPEDLGKHFEAGLISLPIGMENGSPVEGDLDNLQYFFDRGVRYITLAHGLSNHIADSSYDQNRRWQGLSAFGEKVVQEMNRLGIMIDVSHLSDDAIRDVLALSTSPVIASHSSARHFTPGWERNLSDELIVKLADNGGTVMVSFGSIFLRQESLDYDNKRTAAYEEYVDDNSLEESDALFATFESDYAANVAPYPYARLDDVLDHFDHIVSLVGIEHVGIGSDFDGVGDSLPVGLKGVDGYPNLIKGFIDRGYSEADIGQILGNNLVRVWRNVEHRATEISAGESSGAVAE